MSIENTIVVRELTRTFGSFTAVNHISFEVAKGEVFGFLGANGAGKTTAIRMMCGLLKASSGSAKVAGYDINTESEMVKKNIGYMSQKFSLYPDLTVFENFRLYGGLYGLSNKEIKRIAQEKLEKLGLQDLASRMVGALPLGWKQKLAFAVATAHSPKIVFLDEPTSGVDPLVRRQFWEMIYEAAQQGTTILITTHYLDEAQYCDRASIMVEGTIKALGEPLALMKEHDAKSMDEVFFKITR